MFAVTDEGERSLVMVVLSDGLRGLSLGSDRGPIILSKIMMDDGRSGDMGATSGHEKTEYEGVPGAWLWCWVAWE